MYQYIWDAETGGILLITEQSKHQEYIIGQQF